MHFFNPVKYLVILILFSFFSCNKTNVSKKIDSNFSTLNYSQDILDYKVTPKDSVDRSGLMFSDQGAWFAYSLPDSLSNQGGFSGPFLMTQENGIWLSPNLIVLNLFNGTSQKEIINWEKDLVSQTSYASHLVQTFENDSISIHQQLFFVSGNTALIKYKITSKSKKDLTLHSRFVGSLFNIGVNISKDNNRIILESPKSNALGLVQLLTEPSTVSVKDSLNFEIYPQTTVLSPKKSRELIISQTFIFPEYSLQSEQQLILNIDFDSILNVRKTEKENQLNTLINKRKVTFKSDNYSRLLAKAHLTLQNNWRIPAGELKHQGLFPSYHYEWFNGFWSWDSWKHAVGLSYYNTALAKDQMRAMFDYQNEDGFVVDCIYRDTTLEPFNYRDTKPPLSAWAVASIFEKDADLDFIKEMYPKLRKYHLWWYNKRDHDKDGLCEYGSTDGTVLAAKWESGMDNAIRFDNSKILKNGEEAYSLDQESVDLNAYLYAEKLYLVELAKVLNKKDDVVKFNKEAKIIKIAIQKQFYDSIDGWFYDTNLAGTTFVKGDGSEGWTALWANAASQEQAETIKNKMMSPEKFFTKVPFQTMAKDHPMFDPLNGYWRGPNWLDQAYFGIKGLRNYGFDAEADKATIQLIEGAQGLLTKGDAIRENYHPITGEGREAKNFSWSAAHIIMMLTED
ncbi:MAG: trehalase family glycosidase [Maribacter litoralis]|uniref:MGH1-like glycoside hydrolase domain-containing protein n=1 Tax=Maribacter litoralis TaxID=2059726 RepID=UPI0032970E08